MAGAGLGAVVFDAEEEGEGEGGAGEHDEEGSETWGLGGLEVPGEWFDGCGMDGDEAVGEEGINGAVAGWGGGFEGEDLLIGSVEVELE